MTRADTERDILFAAEFASALLGLYIAWKMFRDEDSFKELRMRYFRTVSRTAKKVADGAYVIAAEADTAYWATTNR